MNNPHDNEILKRWDLLLGLAPEGTLKYDRNKLIKDLLMEELTLARKQGYEEGLKETAIKLDKNMAKWLKGTDEASKEFIEAIKKQGAEEMMRKAKEIIETLSVFDPRTQEEMGSLRLSGYRQALSALKSALEKKHE